MPERRLTHANQAQIRRRRRELLGIIRDRGRPIRTRTIVREFGRRLDYGAAGIENLRADLGFLEARGLVEKRRQGKGYEWTAR